MKMNSPMKITQMKKVILLLFLLFTSGLFGQIDFNQVVPKTPEATTMIRYGDNPVNEYTGIPDVSIPIYTVTSGFLSLPITLNYGAGGIKVSEESGIVGLGWSLSAGGSITRSIGGIDDFHAYFDGHNPMPDLPVTGGVFNPETNSIVENDGNCNFIVNGSPTSFSIPEYIDYTYDNNPDFYHYNFNGYAGSFVVDRDGKASLSKKEGLHINLNSFEANSSTWDIVTENGTRYKFEKRQKTDLLNEPNQKDFYSTWFLTKIIGVNGEEIELIYENKQPLEPLKSYVQSYMTNLHLLSNEYQQGQSGYINSQGPATSIEGVYLSEIRFPNGFVRFNYSGDGERLDMRGGYSLNSIQVYSLIDNFEKQIKKIDFDYTYFGRAENIIRSVSQGDYSSVIAPQHNQSINARLRLNAVTENDIKTHSFRYFNGPLGSNDTPNKTTFGQDYWGYFNGQDNENYFIPATQGVPNHADRIPRENFAKTFALKRITYPTKGYTEFDYELNTYRVTSTSNDLPVGTVEKNESLVNVSDGSPLVTELQFTTGEVTPNTIANYEIHLSIYSYDATMLPEFPSDYGLDDMYGEIIGDYTIIPGTSAPKFSFPMGSFIEEGGSQQGAFHTRLNTIILKPHTTYTLRARFDKLNEALNGQVLIKVNWTENDDASATAKQFAYGGGLRVKSIKNVDHNGTVKTIKNYQYHYKEIEEGVEIEKSYGKLKTIPNYSVDHLVGHTVVNAGTTSNLIYISQPLATVIATAGSSNSFSTDYGSYVGYDQVTVNQMDLEGNNNGKTVFNFYNIEDLFRAHTFIDNIDDYTTYPPVRVPTNGLLYEKSIYKREGEDYTLINKSENKYHVNDMDAADFELSKLYQNTDYVLAASKEMHNLAGVLRQCSDFRFQFYPYYSNKIQPTSSTETVYDLEGEKPITTEQRFYYDNDIHLQRTRVETMNSNAGTIETKTFYPDDITSVNSLPEGGNLSPDEYAQIDRLKADDLHRISTPIQTVTKKDGQVVSIRRDLYNTNDNIVLPGITKAAKGNDALEERLLYNDYENGKPIHISKKDGPDVSYIWGYNDQYPIAKIENLPYSAIPASTITDLKNKSNEDNDNCSSPTCNEEILRAALKDIQSAFPNAVITTYTYDPLVGVTSITDPRGYTIFYEYDELQRLKNVKDPQENILSNNVYHYKN